MNLFSPLKNHYSASSNKLTRAFRHFGPREPKSAGEEFRKKSEGSESSGIPQKNFSIRHPEIMKSCVFILQERTKSVAGRPRDYNM